MGKNRWKVIMPKRGTIESILHHIHKHFNACMNVVISNEQLLFLEKIQSRLVTLNLPEEVNLRFQVFRPKTFQADFSTVFPHTVQLERALPGGTLGISRVLSRPPSAMVNAKKAICEQVLCAHLGEETYKKEIGKHQSSIDYLYNYSHQMNLPMPGIIAHRQQATFPHKATGVVSSVLVPSDGEVRLTAESQETYGSALESTFTLLDHIITKLNIEDLCHRGTSMPLQLKRSDPITRRSPARLKLSKAKPL